SRFPLPAIASHGVILRHPLPSGRSCGSTAPDDDAFLSLFHHTPDITRADGLESHRGTRSNDSDNESGRGKERAEWHGACAIPGTVVLGSAARTWQPCR